MEPIVVEMLNTTARTVAPIVFSRQQASSETEQQTVLRAYLERYSLRGVARIFAMARSTIAEWLKAHVQNSSDVKETLPPATPDDVLELDEMWSFVRKKDQARWL